MRFIQHRVADKRIHRLIQKWLKAGVSEDGEWSETKVGRPQGAVVDEAYLQLAESLAGFRSKLRVRAEALDIAVRQQILRLLVKEVLVGVNTITLRHSIPIPQSGPGSNGSPAPSSGVTGSRPSPGYLLRSGSRFTIARQRVPTLRIRSMAGGMAEEGGEGQSDGHSLCGRSGGGFRAPRRGRAVPERVWGTAGEVRAGTASGEDAIEFGPNAARDRRARREGKPESFTFLGFAHSGGTTRQGYFQIRRQTARKRLEAKLQNIKQTLRSRMHEPVPKVGEWLERVLNGHYQYFGVPGNWASLGLFRERIARYWGRLLGRRSQTGKVSAIRLGRLFRRWLPRPKVVHPYPEQRFAVTHPR